ncbi:hypothetical protein MTR67_001994 [Solanum verrucosum]|uniref:Uncharacterized protein n=1 Tax=Solanum verrucosum TaxID=315347 RepID=A0AAF0PP88_SOLVR|nr:hypothetical protein MTR67_001994 [Solanum verrucosum]
MVSRRKEEEGLVEEKHLMIAQKPSALQASKKNNSANNCIKAQRKAMDMSCFLKEVGLDHDDVPLHLGASPHALEHLGASPHAFNLSSCHQTDNLNILPNQVTSSSNFLFGTASSCYQYEGAVLSDGEDAVQDPEVCRYLLQEASGQFSFHATHFYGLKENALATCLIDALSMSSNSDDAYHLLNWQKGGPKTASNSGNFSLVATEVNSSSPLEFSDDVEITQ